MISFIIPTRDRPEQLAITLAHLGNLPVPQLARAGGAEMLVADNASRFVPVVPERLANGVPVSLILMAKNDGAAARNAAARAAKGQWLIMLDDDSHPLDSGFIDVLRDAPDDVAAIGAEIFLLPSERARSVSDGSADQLGGSRLHSPPTQSRGSLFGSLERTVPAPHHREAGGLPEVFIGCGVAIRRSVFLDADLGSPMPGVFAGGGYDPAFHYYAEEYDLAARIIRAGLRTIHHRGFRVMHRKVTSGRDMNTILRRLVRNNAWVEQRYAPEHERRAAIQRVVSRYRAIAEKEHALEGYTLGLGDLDDTLDHQPRAEMTQHQYDRFTGLAAARAHLGALLREARPRRVCIIEPGKNLWVVERAVVEAGVELTPNPDDADTLVIGTLSPGPMLDAAERWAGCGRSVLCGWAPANQRGDGAPIPRLRESEQFDGVGLTFQLNGPKANGGRPGGTGERLRHSA
ncbi:MAG: glycosyltransferase family 2 protein [Phycisphaerales bacterium]